MMCFTSRRSTANSMTDRQLRSVCTTRFATLRWTNSSPGRSPTISFAGTRLSEQPIQRYSGVCCLESLAKNSGSCCTMRRAQERLFSNSSERSFTGFLDPAQDLRPAREGFLRLGEAEPQHLVRRRLAVEHRYRYRGDAFLLRQPEGEVHV